MHRKIIGFLNSYSTGTSGGDVRFVEIMKFLPLKEKLVVTSRLGKEFCAKRGLRADFIETSAEERFKFKNIVFIYFKRILKILLKNSRITKGSILYVGSDVLPDILPAFLFKLFKKDIIWIQMIFHLISAPWSRVGKGNLNNILSFLGQRFALLLIKSRADKVIVINSGVRDALIKFCIPKKKVYIGGMGINRDFFDKLIPSINDSYEGVFIGRIHPSKGIFDLAEIWSRVCRSYPEARLAIIGDGNAAVKDKLIQRIREFSLDENILLLGHLKDIEAYGILKQAKVFLFPSYEEGWGLVIAEAMACGVPVVAYNLDLYKEIFPVGLVKVPVGDKDEFAGSVTVLLMDESRRKLMSLQTLENLPLYNWGSASLKEWDIINENKK